MQSVKQYNLRGYSTGITDGRDSDVYYWGDSDGMIYMYIPSLMVISLVILVILRVLPQQFARL
jgi:hypothetical protein